MSRTPLSASPMFSARGYYKPFTYPWAFNAYRDQANIHWPATEIPLQDDVRDWATRLSGEEKNLITQIFRYFTAADMSIANDAYINAYLPVFKNEEMRMMMSTFASVEAIHCFAEGTEIMTPRGWVDFRDLAELDRVAQYHNDGSIEWVTPLARIKKSHNGEMIRFSNMVGSYDQLVTPEHRCVLNDPRTGAKCVIKTASDFLPGAYNLPTAGHLIGEWDILSDFDRLRIAYQADGSSVNPHVKDPGQKTGKISYRFTLKKERKINRFLNLAEDLGFDHTIRPAHPKCSGGNSFDVRIWVPRETPLSKNFDWVDLSKVSSNWANQFLQEVSEWDGCKRVGDSFCYSSCNKSCIDMVAALAHLCGKRASILQIRIGDDRTSPNWQVHVCSRAHVSGRVINKETILYNGNVYCVTVPTGMILVRYNGCVAVSGNCDAYDLLVETVGMPETEHRAFFKYEAMKAKHDYLAKFGPIECIEDALRNVAVFSMFTEGMQLFASFAILLNFTRFNKMNRMGQIITLSIRDENLHCHFMTQVFKTLVTEHPALLTDELKREIYTIAEEMLILEDHFIDLAFEQGGIEGLSAKEVKSYVRFITNQRLAAAGLKKVIKGYYTNPIPWIEDLLTLPTQESFFENKSASYTSGNVLTGSWSSVFPEPVHTPDEGSATDIGFSIGVMPVAQVFEVASI